MKGLLLLAVGLAALLFVGAGRTFATVAGKLYRVTSELRGERNLALIESGLAELGARDVVLDGERVAFTVNAKKTTSVRLGRDAFVFQDPKEPGTVVRLVVDAMEAA